MPPEIKEAAVQGGCLYVVPTPIGNLEDITYRAVRVLHTVNLIAAEDTRAARILLSRYTIKTPTMSYYKDNEARRCPQLLAHLQHGSAVALISESGMPGISDPGSRLIKACIAENIPVEVLPGPNAAVTALVFSGLPTERFLFLGFLPRGGSKRQRLLESLKLEPGTLVIYEAANRTLKTLADLANFLGDRPASVVRELTKLHQEVLRGTLTSLTHHFHETSPRGEVTLLCGGCPQKQTEEPVDLEAEIGERLSRGESPREIATALAVFGRRTVYQKALAMRKQQG